MQANVLQAKVWQKIWQEKAWQEEIPQVQVAPQALVLHAPWPRLRQVLVWTVIDLAGVRGQEAADEDAWALVATSCPSPSWLLLLLLLLPGS